MTGAGTPMTDPVAWHCVICWDSIRPGSSEASFPSIKHGPFGTVTGDAHFICWADLNRIKNLPPFTGLDRKCPKCHGHVDTEHCRLSYDPGMGAPPELLRRKCSRCGFWWSESTLDAVPADG